MAKVPASIRYKNPGAMWGRNAIARKWGATDTVPLNDGTGQGNNIAVFPTYVKGICAQIDLWRSARYRNKPFSAAIKVWSGGNHVESYIAFVLRRVPGMKRDTIINDDFLRSPSGIAFLKAQAWHEAGQPYPAPDADWLEAQRIVFGGAVVKEVKPKPVVKSKSIAAEVVSLLSLVLAYVTDIRFLLVVVAVVSLFVIYDRYRKGDLVGWFRSPKPVPAKPKKKKAKRK
jgi:hypothetical protein